MPFAVLLLAHAVHGHTAVVELRRPPVSKKIVLERGVPVDCRSNLAHETLGRFMVAAGRLAEEDFQSALTQSAAREIPLGELLIERGLVGGEELFKILQQNLAKKLLDLFTWRQGEFRVLSEPPATESSLKVKVSQLVVTGITRYTPQEEADAAIAQFVGRHLALAPEPFLPFSEIKLTPAQQRLVEALHTSRQLHELVEATGLPLDELARVLYSFALLGAIQTSERPLVKPIAPKPGPVAEPAAAAAPASTTAPISAPVAAAPARPASPTAAPPQAPERKRDELMQIYLGYRRQDPFDLLGLPEDAALPAIEARFVQFAERTAPWAFAGSDLEEKAREIFLTGARAFAQLAEPESRGTLLFRRKTLREESARRPDLERFKIKTDLLDSEVQFRKGIGHREAGRLREAIQQLEFAADCDPGNGLYRAELAHTRFQQSPSAAKQATQELREALRIDPRCGLAALYLGEIEGHLGRFDEAEAAYRQAIRLLAPDRTPIEALKALQSRRKR